MILANFRELDRLWTGHARPVAIIPRRILTTAGAGRRARARATSDKICMRCGKKGHIARICPQRPGAGKGQGRGGEAHFVRYTVLVPPIEDEIDGMETREIHAWLLEENLDDVFEEAIEDEPNAVHVVSCMQVEGLSQEPQPLAPVMSATSSGKACAIIDSGASENIVGKDTLQELADHLQELDFDPSAELR